MDQDPGMTSRALGLWLEKENINIEITSSKNGIADIERCHRTINEKMRIIRTENKLETVAMDMEEIIYNYNHKTRKNAIVEYLDYQIPVTQRVMEITQQQSEIKMRHLPAVDRFKRYGR